MSIKIITHRRRLLHRNAYNSPNKRHRHDQHVLNKAEKIKLNKEKKLAAKNKSKKKAKKTKKPKKGVRLPYRFKDKQLQEYITKKESFDENNN